MLQVPQDRQAAVQKRTTGRGLGRMSSLLLLVFATVGKAAIAGGVGCGVGGVV